jgi:hypothetical protein
VLAQLVEAPAVSEVARQLIPPVLVPDSASAAIGTLPVFVT